MTNPRRFFPAHFALGILTAQALFAFAVAAPICLAQTGTPVPALSALDSVMYHALARYSIKGGALAVVKDGHLIFARGYGLADTDTEESVQPDSLFRWCSISKTITATAIMRLVEQNRLDLDSPVFEILDQFEPYNGTWGDSRLRGITIRQLLHHTGGWDRATSRLFDPVAAEGAVKVSQVIGAGFPPSIDSVIHYMLAQRLDFTPGSRFAYSNFGYELLGRVIEKISGQTYEAFVQETILAHAGISRVQKGSGHLAGRLPGEVKYYDYPGAPQVNSYLSPARERVPAPYGILNPELEDAAGAWVGSAVDLAKFVSLLEGARSPALLSASGFPSMLAQSEPATWVDSFGWYGLGLYVQGETGKLTWDHGGYNPGSKGYFYRFSNGTGFVFMFNGEAADANSVSAYAAQAIANVLFRDPEWPEIDLFPMYYPPRIAPAGVVNGASLQPGALAPGSLIAISGTDLGGLGAEVIVLHRDATETERPLQVISATPSQIKAVLPEDAEMGDGSLTVRREGWPDSVSPISIAVAAPGLFSLNAAGLAAAIVERCNPEQEPSSESVSQTDDSGNIVPRPIMFGGEDETLFLILYGTGVRGRGASLDLSVRLGGVNLTALYGGPRAENPGVDQIRVELPRTLAGAGEVSVQVEVAGAISNTTFLTFQ